MLSCKPMAGLGQRRLSVLDETPIYDGGHGIDDDIGPGADEIDDDAPEGGGDDDE